MQNMTSRPAPEEPPNRADTSPWRLIGWMCAAVIVGSVALCALMIAVRSTGLTAVTVTALDTASEPRDHKIPLIKRKDALPDYEVIVNLNDGQRRRLGAKPNTSAKNGLTWNLSDPVSLADIASIRLQDQDKVISDTITEVQITGNSVTRDGYRFDFVLERSALVGLQSFFAMTIGKAIAVGFCIAVLVFLRTVLPS